MELICYFCLGDDKSLVDNNKIMIVEGRSVCLVHLGRFRDEIRERRMRLRTPDVFRGIRAVEDLGHYRDRG